MALSKQDYENMGRADKAEGKIRKVFSGNLGSTRSWQENAYDKGYNDMVREMAVASANCPEAKELTEVFFNTRKEPSTESWPEPTGVDHGACAIAQHLRHLRTAVHAANAAGDIRRRTRLIHKVTALESRHHLRLIAIGACS